MVKLVNESTNTSSGYTVRTVRFLTQDGETFDVPLEIAKMSELADSMIDDEDGEIQEIPLPNANTSILAKIIEFCQYYKTNPMEEIEKPLKSFNMNEVVDEWYANFVALEQEDLFALCYAANYMKIKPLLNLTCAAIATIIQTKEIRRQFNIINDLTPEEETQFKEENGWSEDF